MRPESTEPEAGSEAIRLWFLGSGRLGVPVLQALVGDPRIDLLGIGTQPDRPAGRKRCLKPTPLAALADDRGWPVERTVSVNAPEFLRKLVSHRPELIVVASFGQLLREDVLGLPTFGCMNIHASLLPRHRGAAPVNAAILAGDAATGISFMRMDQGLDTGPIYESRRLTIDDDETAGDLEERLARQAAESIVDCAWQVCRHGLKATPQPGDGVTYAPRLRKSDGMIDWNQPAHAIVRLVRAMQPWPRAHFLLTARGRARGIQVTKASVQNDAATTGEPGEVVLAQGHEWLVACGTGVLSIERLIPEGRSEMAAADFLRGCPVAAATQLSAPVVVLEDNGQRQ